MNDKLVTLLNDLHKYRISMDAAKTTMSEIIEKAKQEMTYRDADADASLCTAKIMEIVQLINDQCLPQFAMDGEKHLHEAVIVKEFDVVNPYDPQRATAWCFTDFHAGLKLDVKSFESEVKAGRVPAELASVTKEPRVQIASDLSKYLL